MRQKSQLTLLAYGSGYQPRRNQDGGACKTSAMVAVTLHPSRAFIIIEGPLEARELVPLGLTGGGMSEDYWENTTFTVFSRKFQNWSDSYEQAGLWLAALCEPVVFRVYLIFNLDRKEWNYAPGTNYGSRGRGRVIFKGRLTPSQGIIDYGPLPAARRIWCVRCCTVGSKNYPIQTPRFGRAGNLIWKRSSCRRNGYAKSMAIS